MPIHVDRTEPSVQKVQHPPPLKQFTICKQTPSFQLLRTLTAESAQLQSISTLSLSPPGFSQRSRLRPACPARRQANFLILCAVKGRPL